MRIIEERGPIAVVILSIVTLGIYGIYWWYKTSKEMIKHTNKDSSPGLWTLGIFIPIVNIIMFWKHGHLVEEVTGEHSGVLIFVLWLVFAPAAIYLTQKDLNMVA